MTNYKVPNRDIFAWQQPVKDKDLTSPPGSPAKGDRYIIAATASGAWINKEKYITEYDGSQWLFYNPAEGWVVWIDDEDAYYVYSGSLWVRQTLGNLMNLLGNGGQELWARGAGPFTTSGYTSDLWYLTVGAGATVTLTSTSVVGQFVSGTYGVKIDRTVLGTSPTYLYQAVASVKELRGKTVTLSIKVRTDKANTVRISLGDDFATQFSTYHTGNDAWQTLTVKLTVNSLATYVTAAIGLVETGAAGIAYIDEAMLVVGDYPNGVDFIPNTILDEIVEARNTLAKLKDRVVPSGMIMMWHYTEYGSIPDGWFFCDGGFGTRTPNLIDRFPRNVATSSSATGGQAGSDTHAHNGPSHTHTGPSHTHTGPSHTHGLSTASTLAIGSYNYRLTSPTTSSAGTGATGADGTGATGADGTQATSLGSSLPSYTLVMFIMKA